MSQWTHVAGIIRLDNIGYQIIRNYPEDKFKKSEEAIRKALGNTCDYDSPRENWDKCSVPRGSEGSIQYAVSPSTWRDIGAGVWGQVTIWGDLRDFGEQDIPKLHAWFLTSLGKLEKPEGFIDASLMTMMEKATWLLSSFMIRDAVMSIDVEGSPPRALLWDGENKTLITLRPQAGEIREAA